MADGAKGCGRPGAGGRSTGAGVRPRGASCSSGTAWCMRGSKTGGWPTSCLIALHDNATSGFMHGRFEPARDRQVARTPQPPPGGVRGPRRHFGQRAGPENKADPDDHRHGVGEARCRDDPGELAAGPGPGRAEVRHGSGPADQGGCAWRGSPRSKKRTATDSAGPGGHWPRSPGAGCSAPPRLAWAARPAPYAGPLPHEEPTVHTTREDISTWPTTGHFYFGLIGWTSPYLTLKDWTVRLLWSMSGHQIPNQQHEGDNPSMTVSSLAPSWVSRPIFWKRHDWKSTIRCRSNTPGWSLRPRTRLYLRYGSGGGPRSSCFLGRGVLCPSLIEACPWSATWWATLDISGAEYISADWLPDGAPAVLAAPSPSGTSVEPAPSRPHPVLPVARPSPRVHGPAYHPRTPLPVG